jgi:hypothetical protein
MRKKKQKETKLYVYTHSLAELSRPSDILIVRLSFILLFLKVLITMANNIHTPQ